MSWSKGIKFHKKNESDLCDICGLNTIVIESEVFDNGNASNTQVKFCRSCLKCIDMLFE